MMDHLDPHARKFEMVFIIFCIYVWHSKKCDEQYFNLNNLIKNSVIQSGLQLS